MLSVIGCNLVILSMAFVMDLLTLSNFKGTNLPGDGMLK